MFLSVKYNSTMVKKIILKHPHLHMHLSFQSLFSQSDHCAERLQPCLFCNLELPWKELDQHQHVCGSRTELCGDCGHYVILRYQSVHELTCPASSAPSPTNSKPTSDTSKKMQHERLQLNLQSSKHALFFIYFYSQNQNAV